MGRSYTPTYRVEYHDDPFRAASFSVDRSYAWMVKEKGRPTNENLTDWRMKMYESMKPGGCNAHVSEALGYIPVISKARIVHQKTGKVVAEFTAPAFEVLD